MIVCIYVEIYAYLSQRRTEPHVNTVNTMTEALDIKRPDILNQNDGITKTSEHQHLSSHLDLMNVFKLQSHQ